MAQEVRSLALRASEASKNTGDLIAGIASKIAEGDVLVSTAHQAFKEVTNQATRAGALVAEIAEASKEQSEGIGRVNEAVAQMETVIQQLSASADSSATTAEQMRAESEEVTGMMSELAMLIGSRNKTANKEIGPDSFADEEYYPVITASKK